MMLLTRAEITDNELGNLCVRDGGVLMYRSAVIDVSLILRIMYFHYST
jgi:hypothetical protein